MGASLLLTLANIAQEFEVGMPVTRHLPHRSSESVRNLRTERALLMHWAPASCFYHSNALISAAAIWVR